MLADSLNKFTANHAGAARTLTIYTLLMVVAFGISLFATGIIAHAAIAVMGNAINGTIMMLIAGALMYIIALSVVIYVPRKFAKSPTTRVEMGIQRPLSWKDMVLSVPAFIIATILGAILAIVASHSIPGFQIDQVQETGFEGVSKIGDTLMACIALVVLAPIAEELIFRGYFYGKLRTRGVHIAAAMVTTSILFAIAHGQLNVGVNVFALSLVLCGLREITGTVWAGVLVHMIKNGIAFYVLFINPTLLTTMGN